MLARKSTVRKKHVRGGIGGRRSSTTLSRPGTCRRAPPGWPRAPSVTQHGAVPGVPHPPPIVGGVARGGRTPGAGSSRTRPSLYDALLQLKVRFRINPFPTMVLINP